MEASPVQPAQPLPERHAPRVPQPAHDARSTAREFESVFIGEMTKIMMETVETDNGFSGGHGEEMFRGVLAEELGKEIARRGGIGLAPAVMDQIIRMQGAHADGQ
ncbi:rod-binding protein [Sphingobium boeckii]|uniref:Rod binding domain-containing protein n=1 Tax=Sphingobium boeckii TaxID=1082345 RepID=A0A7W9EDF0_9SPHN|nr:rod-binding protein [Sphingobium boeckii]MBB5685218.1 Rod binding domain-containing protein [Sphingobium boeckii]